MKIFLYRSFLCPRCSVARRHLLALCSTLNNVEVEEIEYLSSPRRAWQDNIKMIPAIKIGDDLLSGLFLTKKEIADFVIRHAEKNRQLKKKDGE